MLAPIAKPPIPTRTREGSRTRLTLPQAQCVWDEATGCLSFHDGAGNLLLSEAPGSRHVAQSTIGNEPTLAVTQGFASPADERLYGTGCFQDGHLDIRGLPRRLTQVNTQISQPFVLSSKGYGLLWHNPGMAELNRPDRPIALTRQAAAARRTAGRCHHDHRQCPRRAPRGGVHGQVHGRAAGAPCVPARSRPQDVLAPLCRDRRQADDRSRQSLAAADRQLHRRACRRASTMCWCGRATRMCRCCNFAPVEDRTTWWSPVSDGDRLCRDRRARRRRRSWRAITPCSGRSR